MTDLEKCLAFARELTVRKVEAVKAGMQMIEYVGLDGKTHREYYHSGRWNDRPSKYGEYQQKSKGR